MRKAIEFLVWYGYILFLLCFNIWLAIHASSWWILFWDVLILVDAYILYKDWYKFVYVVSALRSKHRVEKATGVPVALEITFDDEVPHEEN